MHIPQTTLCDDNPCQNDGTCFVVRTSDSVGPVSTNTSLGFQCICPLGWSGRLCERDIDDCLEQPCLNGALCEDRPHMRYFCHCPPGFVGELTW